MIRPTSQRAETPRRPPTLTFAHWVVMLAQNMEPNEVEQLNPVLRSGVPVEALAFFGRWWQLERWLREMVYFELRAEHGAKWTEHLTPLPTSRARGDAQNSYMATADADDLLAYVDVSTLFDLIADKWDLFAPYLPPKTRWLGTADELRDLRNRNAHCRRPHSDDLGRVEQVLRDVESGAWKFYSSYNLDHPVPDDADDPVATAWVKGEHETAQRLLDYADSNYDTRFRLWHATRPWAKAGDTDLSGTPGVIWKADWFLGSTEIRPRELVQRVSELRLTNKLLVRMDIKIGQLTACFSAVDPPDQVADAIGNLFDAILVTCGHGGRFDDFEQEHARWKFETSNLPAKFQAGSAFELASPYDQGAFTIFGA